MLNRYGITRAFGGGLSGRPLKQASLRLAAGAAEHLRRQPPGREFHVVRTGGIETAQDLGRSAAAGVALNQWYTGYFEAFARDGHRLYRRLYREILPPTRFPPARSQGSRPGLT